MDKVVVRAETDGDVKAIDVVNLSAFEGEAEALLVDAVRQSPDFVRDLSLVAEINGRIVGHVLLSKVSLERDGQSDTVLALGPMSVVPSQSHRGIGSALIEAAINRAKGMCYTAIIVAGHPDYYQRFGFQPAEKFGLSVNLELPVDSLTAMELETGVLSQGGQVSFPDAFAALFRQ